MTKDHPVGLPRLAIVAPCYNEEAVLPVSSRLFADKLQSLIDSGKVSPTSQLIFVDDGSSDRTWQIIESLSASPLVGGIRLTRNYGHQNALLAGLMSVRKEFDITISADADGQDDIDAIGGFVDQYLNGYDVVYGVRSSRKKDTAFKRLTAQSYYRLLSSMGVKTVYNHADYRLLSKQALSVLAQYHESNLFLRGLVPLVGLQTSTVEYARSERLAGTSKYPFSKMLALAIRGVTSFSSKPLRAITVLGLSVSVLSLAAIIWVLVTYFMGRSVPGWTSTTVAIFLMGGLQLFSLGMIGEYVAKVFDEVKHRPRFTIGETTDGVPMAADDNQGGA